MNNTNLNSLSYSAPLLGISFFAARSIYKSLTLPGVNVFYMSTEERSKKTADRSLAFVSVTLAAISMTKLPLGTGLFLGACFTVFPISSFRRHLMFTPGFIHAPPNPLAAQHNVIAAGFQPQPQEIALEERSSRRIGG
jgi:hypothetical protein